MQFNIYKPPHNCFLLDPNSQLAENRTEIGFLSGFLTGFLFVKSLSQSERTRCANQKRKSGRGQKRGKGGSDPTLLGFQPPKNPWDRSRPFLNARVRVHASEQTFCNARGNAELTRKGKNTVSLLKVPVKQSTTIKSQLRSVRDVNGHRNSPIYAVYFQFLWLISM